MVSTIVPVADVLMNVVPKMAALAECRQIFLFVVMSVSVKVCYGEYDAGESVKFESCPSHSFGFFPL